jgi:hypothetical protein
MHKSMFPIHYPLMEDAYLDGFYSHTSANKQTHTDKYIYIYIYIYRNLFMAERLLTTHTCRI